MDTRTRFVNVLNFKPVDRLPMLEWAWWWDNTVQRWHDEGLPANLAQSHDIREYLGLDAVRQFWVCPRGENCPRPVDENDGIVRSMEDYVRIKPYLFPEYGYDRDELAKWGQAHDRGELSMWFWLEGFFWFPRTLFGIERHFYAFCDEPELMHRMNSDLLEYNIRMLDDICRLFKPTFLLFAEDMSYNHGPMLSKKCFDEFVSPYYRKIIPEIKKRGIIPFVDTDGDVTSLIPWLEEVGIEGVGPLERMAGVDVVEIRRNHPKLRMIGGFDKTVMHLGEQAIRKEFERLLPVMKQGGYLVCPDHQTPPEVSIDDYRLYVSLLREYCTKAGSIE